MKNAVILLLGIATGLVQLSCGNDPIQPRSPLAENENITSGRSMADPFGHETDRTTSVGHVHEITVSYYHAYVHNFDHDEGDDPGDWYFGVVSEDGNHESPSNFKAQYTRDGPGPVDIRPADMTWQADPDDAAATGFWCIAQEWDNGVPFDYESRILDTPIITYNEWVEGRRSEEIVGDVQHWFRSFIENHAPTVGPIEGPATGFSSTTYTFSAAGADSDGDDFTYEWSVDGAVIDGQTGSLLDYMFTVGNHTIQVRCVDLHNLYGDFGPAKTIEIASNEGARLRKWRISPSSHGGNVGDTFTFRAYVKNEIATEAPAEVIFEITDEAGNLVAELTTGEVILAVGEAINGKLDARMAASWTATSPGVHIVTGYLRSDPDSYKGTKVGIR